MPTTKQGKCPWCPWCDKEDQTLYLITGMYKGGGFWAEFVCQTCIDRAKAEYRHYLNNFRKEIQNAEA